MTKKFWIVYVGKKEYKITEAQYNFMQKESTERGTQTFWFEKFTISLPHVSSMEPIYEYIQERPELPRMSSLEQQQAHEKLIEIRENLKKKVTPKKDGLTTEEVEQRRDVLRKQVRKLKYDD